jgi:hypothetical protein
MAGRRPRQRNEETLFWWHCRCGYANVRYDPCFGCHSRAPRQVRANTGRKRAATAAGEGRG